jgi:predicted deacetylase
MSVRALIVEIHDVNPAEMTEVLAIYHGLLELGIERPALLVVPRFEGPDGRCWDLREHPRTVAWLQWMQRRGAEIVLHGLTHRAPAPPPGVAARLMHRFFSRGCAEFAHMDLAGARRRLLAGCAILRQCGLRPCGFVAPAWQQDPRAIPALQGLGFRFTAFINKLLPLEGQRHPLLSPALTFAAAGPVWDHAKRALMRGVEAATRGRPLVRVALHPADARGSRPLPHILGRVQALLRRRQLMGYGEFLDAAA